MVLVRRHLGTVLRRRACTVASPCASSPPTPASARLHLRGRARTEGSLLRAARVPLRRPRRRSRRLLRDVSELSAARRPPGDPRPGAAEGRRPRHRRRGGLRRLRLVSPAGSAGTSTSPAPARARRGVASRRDPHGGAAPSARLPLTAVDPVRLAAPGAARRGLAGALRTGLQHRVRADHQPAQVAGVADRHEGCPAAGSTARRRTCCRCRRGCAGRAAPRRAGARAAATAGARPRRRPSRARAGRARGARRPVPRRRSRPARRHRD